MSIIYNSVLPFSAKEPLSACFALLSGNKAVSNFESAIFDYTGQHAAVLESGLTAIQVFLRLKGFLPGDEIALPAYLCENVARGLLDEGYRLLFIDVGDDYNLSIHDLERKLTSSTKAVLAVHFYGLPCDIQAVKNITKKSNLLVMEDSAQSFGSVFGGRISGTSGDCGIFSFGWFKPFTAMGGGAIISKDKDLVERCRKEVRTAFNLRKSAIKIVKSFLYANKDMYYRLAVNSYQAFFETPHCTIQQDCPCDKRIAERQVNGFSRLQGCQAGIGAIQIKKIDSFNRRRIENAKKILSALPQYAIRYPPQAKIFPLLRLPIIFKGYSNGQIARLSSQLLKLGVDAPVLYPYLPYILGFESDCQNAKYLSEHTLHLPVHPCLSERDIRRIVLAINDVLQNENCKENYSSGV